LTYCYNNLKIAFMRHLKQSAFVPGIPLYRQVQDRIEDLIRANGRPEKIPLSDNYLAEHFKVSRITVRRAVDELVDAGVLYRIQGVGTFLRPRKLREQLTLNSFLDPWAHRGERLDVRVGKFEQIAANREIAEQLSVLIGEPVIYVQRLRFQGKTLVAVDDRYLHASYGRRLTAQDVLTSSLVDFLRNRAGVEIANGEMDIEARAADQRAAKMLSIKQGQPILFRRVTFFAPRQHPVLTGVSVYRADRVSYRVRLSE
jgi:DNA-binding GntR family transcriptional regulator